MNDDQIWDDFQFEEPSNKFLMLNIEIMERICRFLVDKKDSYKACLIHPNWSIAAVKVLWEAPRFQRPEQLRAFMNTIFSSKKAALMVRDLYLVLLDTKEETVFKTIVRSNLDRHSKDNAKVLAAPKFLNMPIRICEELTTLTCYGWQMGRADWEQLSVMAKHLVKLRIIGGSLRNQLSISNLLSRLTSLHLDGCFHIDDSWANNLINRATQLSDLQLSLTNLQYNTLELICTPNRLKLKKLSLTGASEIKDVHVDRVLRAFPNLTKFCLEGCTHISAQTIMLSLAHCRYLRTLEIRAHSDTLQQDRVVYFDRKTIGQTPKLTSLLIENMGITDSNLHYLSSLLPQLQTLGLKGCPQITNRGLENILVNPCIKYIRRLHLIKCPNVDSSLLSVDGMTAAMSLYDLHIESCGFVSPIDIHSLCSQSIGHNLRQIRLAKCDGLKNSVLSAFDCSSDSTDLLTLNKITIDALAHTNDPQLCPLPNERLLTGRQIVILSKQLDMTVKELIKMIDKAQKAEHADSSEIIENGFKNTYKIASKSHVNRLDALRPSATPRPGTPALWSKDFIENGDIGTIGGENIVEPYNLKLQSENYRENDEDEDYEEDGEEEDAEIEVFEEIEEEVSGSQLNDNKDNFMSWGASNNSYNNVWNSDQTSQYTPTQTKEESWPRTESSNQTDLWQQEEAKPTQQLFKKPSYNKHYRNSPFIREGEGWGEPEKVIPWEDLRTQGYAHDVLKEQEQTTFWNEVDGIWYKCQNVDSSSEKKVQTSASYGQTAPQPLFSVLEEEQRKHYNGPLPCVSSDEDNCWNNDGENLVVKVNPKSESYRLNVKGTNSSVEKRATEERFFTEETTTNTKNGWGNIAKSNPMPRRQFKPVRNNNRVTGREDILPENMPGRWKEFTANNLFTIDTLVNVTPSPDISPATDQKYTPKYQVSPRSTSPLKSPQQLSNHETLAHTCSSPKREILVDLGDDIKNNEWQTTTTNYANDTLVTESSFSKQNSCPVSMENCFWFNDQTTKTAEEKNSSDLDSSSLLPNVQENSFNTTSLVELNDEPVANATSVFENKNSVSESLLDSTLELALNTKTEPTSNPITNPLTPATVHTQAPAPTAINNSVIIPSYADSEEEARLYKSHPNYIGSLRVYVSENEFKYLVMSLDEEVEDCVKKFCDKYHVEQNAAVLLEKARQVYVRRKTKKILRKKKE